MADPQEKPQHKLTKRGKILVNIVGTLAGGAFVIGGATVYINDVNSSHERGSRQGYIKGYEAAQLTQLLAVDLNDDGHNDLITCHEGINVIFMNQGHGNYLSLDQHVESRRRNAENIYDGRKSEAIKEIEMERAVILSRVRQGLGDKGEKDPQ